MRAFIVLVGALAAGIWAGLLAFVLVARPFEHHRQVERLKAIIETLRRECEQLETDLGATASTVAPVEATPPGLGPGLHHRMTDEQEPTAPQPPNPTVPGLLGDAFATETASEGWFCEAGRMMVERRNRIATNVGICPGGCLKRRPVMDDICLAACRTRNVANSSFSPDSCVLSTKWDCSRSLYDGVQRWTCDGGRLFICDSDGNGLARPCEFNCKANVPNTDDTCQAAPSPCLAAVRRGQQYCLDPDGTLYTNYALQRRKGATTITDAQVQGRSFELNMWFEFSIPAGFNEWKYSMALQFVESGIASVRLPANLPTGLCPQKSPTGQSHPFRLSGIHYLGASFADGTTYATASTNAGDFQTGLVASGMPDQTGAPQNYPTMIVMRNTNGTFSPAGQLAKQDMYGPQQYCAP